LGDEIALALQFDQQQRGGLHSSCR
jgi:hypothetical protein